MAAVHRHGFTSLSGEDTSAEQSSLNIIFVHGLRGHPQGTWETAPVATKEHRNDATKKHRSVKSWFLQREAASLPTSTGQAHASSSSLSSVFWPEQYLAPDIPQARVWTYGYNADVIGGLFQANNKNSISQHGRDLSVRLEREIDNSQPIAFVVHSLGGIIVKDAIRRSDKIRERTKLIIFLGTPHRGSAYAGWGQIASNLARLALQDSNKKMLEALEVNSEVLDNIHEEFKTIVFKGGIKIHSFQEARGISGMKGLDEKVVDDFSSKLDLPQQLEIVESIDADHMQMARYNSKNDQGYRAIRGILRSFVQQELESSPDALFMVPFAKDDLFVGREDIISEISRKRAASRSHTRLALVGLGGIGKSQIAIEYAYRVQQAEPHTLVVWIHASNRTRFEQRYRDIADSMLLPGREDPKVDVLQLVCAWLSDRRHGQWLIILDNADDDAVFFGGDKDSASPAQVGDITSHKMPLGSFLPQTQNGTILITSRNNLAATNLVGTYGSVVRVEPMEEEDALALLKTRVLFNDLDKAEAKALVQALERIPLAITQAAAYINTRAQTTTMSSYLDLFRESEANQVRLLGRKGLQDLRRDHSIRHAVIATWQISFTQIQKTEQSAVDLLALMSMFDRQGIPMSLLRKSTNQLDFDDALAPLLSFSLVQADVGKQSFGMHRLVQLSVRTWLEADRQLSRWIKESIRVMSTAFPSGDYKTWVDCQAFLSHSREAMGHATGDEEDMMNQARIGLRVGWYLLLRGEYKAAEKVDRMCVGVREKVLGEEHPDTLTSVNQLGSVLESQGKYEEAEAMHWRALRGREKVLGVEHPVTLTSVSELGSVLSRQGKYEEAEAMHRRALRRYEKVLGVEHPDTLTSVSQLGSVLSRQGKYEEAEAMHLRALRGSEKVLGVEHPDTLTSVSQLGSALLGQGKYEEAEAMDQRALRGYKKVLGVEHPHTLTSMANLASTFWRQGRWKDAEDLEVQVMETKKRVLGPEHLDTLTAMGNLAFTLKSQCQNEEAISLMDTCFQLRKRILGDHHPYTKSSLETLNKWQMENIEIGK